jgi:hypothetical protein
MATKKKKSKKKTSKKKLIKTKQDKEVAWIVGILVLLFILIVGGYALGQYIKNKNTHFEYLGVEWDIQEHGDLQIFHSRFPVVYEGKTETYQNVYLRYDPRELDVPVTYEGEENNFMKANTAIIAVQPDANNCDYRAIAFHELKEIADMFPWISSSAVGYNEEDNAITCENASLAMGVYLVETSEEPRIVVNEDGTCITLQIGQCQELETIETYITQVIGQIF